MVNIVIVNWNTGDRLAACIRSLAALPERSLIKKIFVIDNDSSDTSFPEAERVTIDVPVEYIASPKNVGFAKANNIALKMIVEAPEHTLLLNPDTEVMPGALKAMLDALSVYPKAGIIGPQLLNYDRSLQPSVRSFPNTLVLTWLFLKLHRIVTRVPWWQQYLRTSLNYYEAQSVDQVMGAAFLIRNRLLDKNDEKFVGILDEAFWIWFEEVDYCRRAKNKGWEVWYVPTGIVIHHGALSFNQTVGLKKTVPLLNSGLTYAHKHLSKLGHLFLGLLWPLAALLAVPATIFHLLHKRKNSARLYEWNK